MAMASFEEAVVRAKVARICEYVGYHAITKESTAILVDLYVKTFIHLARHCKDFANNNRRVEPTLTDLIQAYDFIGISIPELKEHADNVKIPLDIKFEREEAKPSNRIQRDRFVDDQLEEEKNNDPQDDNEDGANDCGADEEDKNMTPLLKDIFQEIANKFPSPSKPVKADKVRIKREEKPIIPKLKITPLDPSIAEPPSFLPILENIKQENLESVGFAPPPLSDKPGRGRRKGVKTKVPKSKLKATQKNAKLKTKIKTKATEGQKRGRKPAAARGTTSAKAQSSPEPKEPSPAPSTPGPEPKRASPSPPPQPVASTSAISKAKIKLEPLPEKRRSPTPLDEALIEPPPTKPSKKDKKKKKKRSSNQFAIVTETVTADSNEDKEWVCPTCKGPDNGGLMVGCDYCDLWYHLLCTNLKREPKDEEKWACVTCASKKPPPLTTAPVVSVSRSIGAKDSKKGRKRSRTPSEVPVKISDSPEPALAQPVKRSASPDPSEIVDRPTVICTSADDLCPECQLPYDGAMMIQCDEVECHRWFHGRCVGVLEQPSHDDSWFCARCVESQQTAFKRRRRI